MSGDLEDFLARAARRRAEKAEVQRGQQVQSESRRNFQEVQSQYSDRRRERVVLLTDDDDDIVEAEIVDDAIMDAAIIKDTKAIKSSLRDVSDSSALEDRNKSPKRTYQATSDPQAGIRPAGGLSSLELVEMLSRPGGIRQAFLLKEIMDRPVRRWE